MFARCTRLAPVVLALAFVSGARAIEPDAADRSIRQFLAHGNVQPAYRAVRRLEAANGNQTAWLEAVTAYSPATGFHYEITAQGGSDYIRAKVLKAVLDAERDTIARGESARASLAPSNYIFQPNGIDANGHANVLLSPRRKDPALVSGMMALSAGDGELIRLQGRLAKSPSFWLKSVDIVRTYTRVGDAVLPVALETKAQVRFAGEATLRMTYAYSEVSGRPIASGR